MGYICCCWGCYGAIPIGGPYICIMPGCCCMPGYIICYYIGYCMPIGFCIGYCIPLGCCPYMTYYIRGFCIYGCIIACCIIGCYMPMGCCIIIGYCWAIIII